MAAARVVCWLNREDWLQCYKYLYSDNAELQRKGLDRVLAWKSRSGGKLPLAIESTADLVLGRLDTDLPSSSFTFDKQLAVSMALVRFVNGMADMCQKGVYARSVHSIAEEIGLPDWLVDLRHEATHASLPSQDTLHAGVDVSLSWLQQEYWEAQVSAHQDAEETLGVLLEKYTSIVNKTKKKNIDKQAAKVETVIDKITSCVRANNLWSQLQSLLLSNNFFQSSNKDESNTTNQDTNPGLSQPENMKKIWYPLFQSLDKISTDFIPLIILGILESHSEDNPDTATCLLHWALWLMQSSSGDKQVFSCKLPWLTILEVSLRNPNFLLGEFVDLILEEVTLTDALKERIKSFVDVSNGQNVTSSNVLKENFDMKKADHFKSINHHKKVTDNTMHNSQNSSAWVLDHSQTKWDLIPFGEILACEEQTVDALELPVFVDKHLDICSEEVNVAGNEFVNEYEEEMDESESDDDDQFGDHDDHDINEEYSMNENSDKGMDGSSQDGIRLF